jgi:hypothetical protein
VWTMYPALCPQEGYDSRRHWRCWPRSTNLSPGKTLEPQITDCPQARPSPNDMTVVFAEVLPAPRHLVASPSVPRRLLLTTLMAKKAKPSPLPVAHLRDARASTFWGRRSQHPRYHTRITTIDHHDLSIRTSRRVWRESTRPRTVSYNK